MSSVLILLVCLAVTGCGSDISSILSPDTLSITPISTHTYGDAVFQLSATSPSSGQITYSVVSGNARINGSRIQLTGAGTVVVRADQVADTTYAAATATTSFTVLKGADSLYFLPMSLHAYGEPAFLATASATSANSSPIVYTVVSGPATYAGNYLTLTGAGTVVLAASQAPDNNFNGADTSLTFSAGKATPDIEFDPIAAHTYGDPPFAVNATAANVPTPSVSYLVASGPASIAGNMVTLTGAGTVVLRAASAASANYNAATTDASLAIQKATDSLTFTLPSQMNYGDPPYTLSAISNQNSTGTIAYTVVSGPGSITGNMLTLTAAGALSIRAAQASDANYKATNTIATTTVQADSTVLTFVASPRHVYGDAPFTVSASSQSPGPITYRVVSGPATISGNVVTITGVGSVVLQADQAAYSTYPAQSAQETLTIYRGDPQLTFPPITGVIDGDPPVTLKATSRSSSPVTYSVVSGPATIQGNSLTITDAGSVVVSAAVAADPLYTSATVQQTISVATANTSPVGLIKHVVVIFQENVSFDHYFGTYPNAVNSSGEPAFTALPGTPSVDGLQGSLLTTNPNSLNPRNGSGATNPFRLSRSMAATADQNHGYPAEQIAFNNGAMDLFPRTVGTADSPQLANGSATAATSGMTMAYFDGNTVTGMWNYAQHFAMSDHFFGTVFGPSTLGALNLISGQTNGAVNDRNAGGTLIGDGYGGYTVVSDPQPINDICDGSTTPQIHMTGRNIGDMLNDAGISWGFFQQGFDTTVVNPNGTTGCVRTHKSAVTTATTYDYIPHHQPFQYYASTANPKHLRPLSTSVIGTAGDTTANHQYDTHDFEDALAAGNFPAVIYLKAPAYQDGHAGYSDPLDEQTFVVHMVNEIQNSPEWKNTAIIIAYDDSDGWYDHAFHVINGSTTMYDGFSSSGHCLDGSTALPGVASSTTHAQGRCGYGPRLPLLVISPWAKPNYVDSGVIDQTSIMRFIEDTFLQGRRLGQGSFDSISGSMNPLFDFRRPTPQNLNNVQLDPNTGLVVSTQ